MANFWIHVFLVTLCIGLGYVIRFAQENWTALEAQIKRMANPEVSKPYASTYQPPAAPMMPQAMSQVRLTADPDKLAQLKTAMKGSKDA